MENTIIDMLIYGKYDELSQSFNIPNFEAKMLSEIYKKLNYQSNRGKMINGIMNGYYNRPEEIKNMAKLYIKNVILHTPDNGRSFLINNCGFSELDAYNAINGFIASNNALSQNLSYDLDTSSIENQLNTTLEYLTQGFLTNGQGRGL